MSVARTGTSSAPIHVDDEGRFSVSGSYMLRAYPIPIGPTVPAQMAGEVRGRTLTFSIAVNDTVTKELVVLGPSTVCSVGIRKWDRAPFACQSAKRRSGAKG